VRWLGSADRSSPARDRICWWRPSGQHDRTGCASIDRWLQLSDRSKSQAAIRGPSRARVPGPAGTEVIDDCGGAPSTAMRPSGTSPIGSWWLLAVGPSLTGTGTCPWGPATRSWTSSPWSERGPGESTAYAWSLRNCVQVGLIRRGAGPSPPWRSTVAMVVADTSMPSFKSSPLILR
jgi:hypothetical protein